MTSGQSAPRVERRLAAILAADVVGSSRLMETDEEGTIGRLGAYRTVVDGLVKDHHGRVFGGAGDSVVAEFASPVEAVRCAIDIQQEIERRNAGVRPDRQMRFRIGINLGDVIVEDDNLLGDGINVAARLEALAGEGGLCVSQSIYEQIRGKIEIPFEDSGDHQVKNIARNIRVWSWAPGGRSSAITAPRPRPDAPSVAVLPFVNMSGDSEQEYFSDGITEDIITDLSKISGLFVPSRNSSFTYKGTPVKVETVARELGVRHVLEGSVRKSGTRVRITAQLIDNTTGGHLWAERYDRDLTDVFAVQDEITHRIVESLRVSLLPMEREAIEKVPTENVEAYNFYLLGRQFFRRHSGSSYEVAKRMFERAIELDPNYARAWAGVADCESFLFNFYLKSPVERILEASAKAIELDPDLAEGHASRGAALSIVDRLEESEAEFQTAFRLEPNLYEAHYFYSRACFAQGRMNEAAASFQRASEIRPDDFESPVFLMQSYRVLGRSEDAEAAGLLAFERIEAEIKLRPENVRAIYLGASYFASTGQTSRAREWISRALLMEPDDVRTRYNAACVYAQLGEPNLAIDLLGKALPIGHTEIRNWVQHDTDLDSLRSHPRFIALLESTAG
ncbi:MAG TPA: adenylate/guanylate cyclase domain-containing protein [Acidimicrobiia bacterium]|nr:adenylate/guanylate cyclase domain-containing protein [Acidimicrobiia bacterium]